MLRKSVLLVCAATTTSLSHAITEGHFEPPSEEDVDILVPCIVDENGFGGEASQTSFLVRYYQEVEYIAGDGDIDSIVRDLELATVDLLLEAAQINCVLPPRSRFLQTESSRRVVGISANPEDQVLELDCIQLNTTNECAVVDAGFEVFYTGQGTEDDGFEESFLTAVQGVIDNGDLNDANDQIVNVAVTDANSYTRVPPGGGNGVNEVPDAVIAAGENDSTTILIAALAGTALVGGAAFAYRRASSAAAAANANDAPPPGEEIPEEDSV